MAQIKFSPDLSPNDRTVVGNRSMDVLNKCATESRNSTITITSTLRPPKRQAEAMYANLAAGKRIAYKAPGQAVTKVYDDSVCAGLSKNITIAAMQSKIEELAAEDKLVSKHCVTPESYAIENIIDISTRIPNPRDMVKALSLNPFVTKVISPYRRADFGEKVVYDINEPAIHVQIKQ